MNSASTGRLDFVLRLIDRVSTPLSRVQTSFSDLATRGQAGITQTGMGMAGVVGTAVALQRPCAGIGAAGRAGRIEEPRRCSRRVGTAQ